MNDEMYQLVESPPLTAPMAAAAAQYWTPARIATIQPIPLRTITRQRGEVAAARAALAGPVAGGRTLIALPTPPKSASTAASGVSNADTAKVADMTAPPYCYVGKLWITFADVGIQSSAWVIGKKAILTAGHCVYSNGGFASNIEFLPQYRAGVDQRVEHDAPDALRVALGEQADAQRARRRAVEGGLAGNVLLHVLRHGKDVVGAAGDVGVDRPRLIRAAVALAVEAPGVVAQAREPVHHRRMRAAGDLQVVRRHRLHRFSGQ